MTGRRYEFVGKVRRASCRSLRMFWILERLLVSSLSRRALSWGLGERMQDRLVVRIPLHFENEWTLLVTCRRKRLARSAACANPTQANRKLLTFEDESYNVEFVESLSRVNPLLHKKIPTTLRASIKRINRFLPPHLINIANKK